MALEAMNGSKPLLNGRTVDWPGQRLSAEMG